MSRQEREKIVEQFRCGAIDILCNVDLISEGFDVPDCGCVIMLRPTQSLTLFIQQSMRCMRYRPGKRAVILDHVGNYARHGMPDDDREWSLKGRPKNKGNAEPTAESNAFVTCQSCYAVYPKTMETCPQCGAKPEKRQREEIGQSRQTELTKITGFTINTKTPAECRTMEELQAYARDHGYKIGWAYYQMKERRKQHQRA